MSFVHLHLHTQFSFLEGAIKIEELVAKASEFQMRACAITDHGNLCGAIKFYQTLKKQAIKAIIGQGFLLKDKDAACCNLICLNKLGYQNLIKLSTLSYTEGKKLQTPYLKTEWLEKYNEGLFLLLGEPDSNLAKAALSQNFSEALQTIQKYQQIFGSRLYLEISDSGIESQKDLKFQLQKLSKQANVDLVATNPCFYLTKQDAYPQFILQLMGKQQKLDSNSQQKPVTEELYFKNQTEMEQIFKESIPESLINSIKISDACELNLDNKQFFLPAITATGNTNLEAKIHQKSNEGLKVRLKQLKKLYRWEGATFEKKEQIYLKRLEYELKVITEMGYSGYFLIVSDFVLWAKQNDILVGPGRGSGAGSLTAYSLFITNIDPLGYDLLFERFLNPGRKSMPDIDIDFDTEKRQLVIEYIKNKYGKKNVCQISALGSLQPKAAIKGVARVLNFSYMEAETIANMIPNALDITIEKAIEQNSSLAEMQENGQEKEKELLKIALRLEGLNSNLSTHPAGIIIMDTAIDSKIPLCTAKDSEDIQSQYSMEDAEQQGAVKFDILGLQNLTIIRHSVKKINQQDPNFDLNLISLDKTKIFRTLGQGLTVGVFQMESYGITKLIRKMNPTKFEDLIAIIALYRPGPLGSGMINDYINRKKLKQKIEYPHPLTENILKPTYGVLIYQEQVMRIVQEVAGFSLSDADIFRRAMGKKNLSSLMEQKEKFIEKCNSRNVSTQAAENLFNIIDKFGGYGFNKSHSAAYALISYQTAYLKSYYPKEFYLSMINSELNNSTQIKKILDEIRKQKFKILPPCINRSQMEFTFDGDTLVFGLTAIKGIGKTSFGKTLEKRNPEFKDLLSFCKSLDKINSRVMSSLIKVGAFDCLEKNRKKLFNNLEYFLEIAEYNSREQLQAGSLFEDLPTENIELDSLKLKDSDDWSFEEKLEQQKEVVGFYLGQTPLSFYRQDLIFFHDLTKLRNLELPKTKQDIWIICYVYNLRISINEQNKKKAELQLEDNSASYTFFISADKYSQIQSILDRDSVLLCKLSSPHKNNPTTFFINKVFSLEKIRQKFANLVAINFNTNNLTKAQYTEKLQTIKELIEKQSGNNPVIIKLISADTSIALELSQKITITKILINSLTKIVPIENIVIKYNKSLLQKFLIEQNGRKNNFTGLN